MIEKYFTHINSLIKNKIQDKLKFSQKIHLVIEEWSSAANKKYMSIIIFFPDGEFLNLGLK